MPLNGNKAIVPGEKDIDQDIEVRPMLCRMLKTKKLKRNWG
jgi:hypothetical protein